MEPTAQLLTENDPSRYQDYVTDAPHLKLLKRGIIKSQLDAPLDLEYCYGRGEQIEGRHMATNLLAGSSKYGLVFQLACPASDSNESIVSFVYRYKALEESYKLVEEAQLARATLNELKESVSLSKPIASLVLPKDMTEKLANRGAKDHGLEYRKLVISPDETFLVIYGPVGTVLVYNLLELNSTEQLNEVHQTIAPFLTIDVGEQDLSSRWFLRTVSVSKQNLLVIVYYQGQAVANEKEAAERWKVVNLETGSVVLDQDIASSLSDLSSHCKTDSEIEIAELSFQIGKFTPNGKRFIFCCCDASQVNYYLLTLRLSIDAVNSQGFTVTALSTVKVPNAPEGPVEFEKASVSGLFFYQPHVYEEELYRDLLDSVDICFVGFKATLGIDEGPLPFLSILVLQHKQSTNLVESYLVDNPLDYCEELDKSWPHEFLLSSFAMHCESTEEHSAQSNFPTRLVLVQSTWSKNLAVFHLGLDPAAAEATSISLKKVNLLNASSESSLYPEVTSFSILDGITDRPWMRLEEGDGRKTVDNNTYVVGSFLSLSTKALINPFSIVGSTKEIEGVPDYSAVPTLLVLTSDGIIECVCVSNAELQSTKHQLRCLRSPLSLPENTRAALNTTTRLSPAPEQLGVTVQSTSLEEKTKEELASRTAAFVASDRFLGSFEGYVYKSLLSSQGERVLGYCKDLKRELTFVPDQDSKNDIQHQVRYFNALSVLEGTNLLTAVYKKYNREKLSSVSTLLQNYEGKYYVLFARLAKKYGFELPLLIRMSQQSATPLASQEKERDDPTHLAEQQVAIEQPSAPQETRKMVKGTSMLSTTGAESGAVQGLGSSSQPVRMNPKLVKAPTQAQRDELKLEEVQSNLRQNLVKLDDMYSLQRDSKIKHLEDKIGELEQQLSQFKIYEAEQKGHELELDTFEADISHFARDEAHVFDNSRKAIREQLQLEDTSSAVLGDTENIAKMLQSQVERLLKLNDVIDAQNKDYAAAIVDKKVDNILDTLRSKLVGVEAALEHLKAHGLVSMEQAVSKVQAKQSALKQVLDAIESQAKKGSAQSLDDASEEVKQVEENISSELRSLQSSYRYLSDDIRARELSVKKSLTEVALKKDVNPDETTRLVHQNYVRAKDLYLKVGKLNREAATLADGEKQQSPKQVAAIPVPVTSRVEERRLKREEVQQRKKAFSRALMSYMEDTDYQPSIIPPHVDQRSKEVPQLGESSKSTELTRSLVSKLSQQKAFDDQRRQRSQQRRKQLSQEIERLEAEMQKQQLQEQEAAQRVSLESGTDDWKRKNLITNKVLSRSTSMGAGGDSGAFLSSITAKPTYEPVSVGSPLGSPGVSAGSTAATISSGVVHTEPNATRDQTAFSTPPKAKALGSLNTAPGNLAVGSITFPATSTTSDVFVTPPSTATDKASLFQLAQSPSTPTALPSGGIDYRQELLKFYEKYNQSKLSSIDATLAKYKSKEEQLFRNLYKKYKISATDPDNIFNRQSGSMNIPSNSAGGSFGTPSSNQANMFSTPTQQTSSFSFSGFSGSAGNSTPGTQSFSGFATPLSGQSLGGGNANQQVDHRQKLVEFYQKYNPSKLSSVDATLTKYKGREAALFAQLHKKYVTQGQQNAQGFGTPTSMTGSSNTNFGFKGFSTNLTPTQSNAGQTGQSGFSFSGFSNASATSTEQKSPGFSFSGSPATAFGTPQSQNQQQQQQGSNQIQSSGFNTFGGFGGASGTPASNTSGFGISGTTGSGGSSFFGANTGTTAGTTTGANTGFGGSSFGMQGMNASSSFSSPSFQQMRK